MNALDALRAQLGQFAARMIEDTLLSSLPSSWERRAEQLEDARPRPTDFNGAATVAALALRDRELAEAAAACRERAELLRRYPDIGAADVVAVVAAALAEIEEAEAVAA